MSYTKEPWKWVQAEKGIHIVTSAGENVALFHRQDYAEQACASVNGCAGFNPSAYRACVEALKRFTDNYQCGCDKKQPPYCATCQGKHALTLAEQTP